MDIVNKKTPVHAIRGVVVQKNACICSENELFGTSSE